MTLPVFHAAWHTYNISKVFTYRSWKREHVLLKEEKRGSRDRGRSRDQSRSRVEVLVRLRVHDRAIEGKSIALGVGNVVNEPAVGTAEAKRKTSAMLKHLCRHRQETLLSNFTI